MSLGALRDMEEEPSMWIADQWQDYELLDCGGGEKLERWDKQYLVRPDPQAIWETPRRLPEWKRANARYLRSQTGGGHWEKKALPESWQVHYKDLTFQVKPMNFKHTGLFPEQAVNWDFVMDKIRKADRPIRVPAGGRHPQRDAPGRHGALAPVPGSDAFAPAQRAGAAADVLQVHRRAGQPHQCLPL